MCISTVPLEAFDDADYVGAGLVRRHEVGDADFASIGFEFGFQD